MPYASRVSDPWHIPHPEAGRHYRWISGDARRLGLWTRSYGETPGYKLERGRTVEETKELASKLGLSDGYVDESLNVIRYGHNVLGSIPDTEYMRRAQERIDEQIEKTAAAKDAAYAQAELVKGVRMYEADPDDIADRKSHAQREDRPFSGQSGVGASPTLRAKRAIRV